ncbi:sol narae metalloprotease isoform X2 [Lycorma delicatula]|uniref:sol narae metalloprotease isoform X2 n=1 Tax=Lycorma delicatula TaxID=130591 RepID=UPI003F511E9A
MATTCSSFAHVILILFSSWHVLSSNIHRHMNTDELRRVFQVDNHNNVPDYEVVRVHSVRRRDTEEGEKILKLKAFGRDLHLSLSKTPNLYKDDLKVWTAETNSTGHLHYHELPQEPVGDVYQDEESEAALLIHTDNDDGSLLIEGTIGHDLIVKPVPASVRQHLDERRKNSRNKDDDDDEVFMDDEVAAGEDFVSIGGFPLPAAIRNYTSQNNQRRHTHIVYKRSENSDSQFNDYAFMEPDEIPQVMRTKRSATTTKREAPYVIYPEILVIVDYDGYRLHGGDNVQIKRYFVSFWNGVDLRYKLLKGPKIRISIAGIIISRGRDATPYLERNRVGRDAIDSAAALTDMGKYLFRERRLPVYDIAVAVTKYDMCRRRKGGRCTKGTAGFAYVGGACVVNKRLEKVNSVAIIEDTGGFSGIIVAAHEVGHLLGAVHDGSPPPTYLGGPGAEKCRWEDGFIMSDLRHTEKGFRWSPCSVASFHHFLNGDTATCLYNSPHEDESLPRVLPGKLLTLDAQCRKDRGTSACFKDDRVCAQLFCFDAGSGYCVAYRPAAEGSPCGDGQFCTNGRCVAEHENIIPDYSQNTPSYLRRSDSDAAATQSRPVYANLNSTTVRSEWNEFWRTAIPTTTKPPEHHKPSTNPYQNLYNAHTVTTVQNEYNDYYGKSTKYPHLINNNLQQTTVFTTTKNPYDFADFDQHSHTTKNPTVSINDHDYFHTTVKPTTKITGYNKQYYSTGNLENQYTSAPSVGDTDCVDTATNIKCGEFLTRYGYQYCGTAFIKKHCCAAQKYLCEVKAFDGHRR